jgi:phospholipid-binding lipoprotein MlaA
MDATFQYRARTVRLALVVLLGFIGLCACATIPPAKERTPADPWEGLNRKVFAFNDTVDRWTLKPVAKAYKKVTPSFVRTGVGNFFHNLQYPSTILNQLLQGKLALAGRDSLRLFVNTVFGVGGLFDVATPNGLAEHDEDLGQTLAVWGVPAGPYVVLPLLGPTSVRDAPATYAQYFVDPLTYADMHWQERAALRALDFVGIRAELLSLEPTLDRVYDRYAFIRDAWAQRRRYLIYDGNPPEEPLDLEEDWGDDDDGTDSP